ncbi:hypothetical protein LXL04_034483 [Taraxacum kok-saghyz]
MEEINSKKKRVSDLFNNSESHYVDHFIREKTKSIEQKNEKKANYSPEGAPLGAEARNIPLLLNVKRKIDTKQIRKGLRTYRNRRTQVPLAGMAASCSACEEDEGRPCFVGGLPCSRSLSLPPLPSPSSRCPLTLPRRSICSGLVWVDLICRGHLNFEFSTGISFEF